VLLADVGSKSMSEFKSFCWRRLIAYTSPFSLVPEIMMFQFRISNCFREVIALRQVLVVCAHTTPENLKNKASYRFSCFFCLFTFVLQYSAKLLLHNALHPTFLDLQVMYAKLCGWLDTTRLPEMTANLCLFTMLPFLLSINKRVKWKWAQRVDIP